MPAIKDARSGKIFDARPDRIDLRDREYRPILESLPAIWPDEAVIKNFNTYAAKLILDQGEEGACTGFGLAAVINYLLWKKNHYKADGLEKVSPRMLYHLARIYDEWPGENYEGSSCRGAMRGWYHHGVTTAKVWPYRNNKNQAVFVSPKKGWQIEAAKRPLGAYYRINKDSINDLQAAIFEVGAIYCAATVHEGWFLNTTKTLPVISFTDRITGGHAFAIVGYNADGFIVQNSWGPGWGFYGFAVMGYEEWMLNGSDAWVAVMGATTSIANVATTFQSAPLFSPSSSTALSKSKRTLNTGFNYKNKKVTPINTDRAYQLSIVLGNNGAPINRNIECKDAVSSINRACFSEPKQWFHSLSPTVKKKLAIYIHGGLNSEDASINRVRMMAPYFLENEIYPIFMAWRTSFKESLVGILQDGIKDIFKDDRGLSAEGVLDKIRDKLSDAKDRTIEVTCENLLVKPIWSEMKQNAQTAANAGGGVQLLVQNLKQLIKDIPDLEIHAIGHSAGSIVLGHLLSEMPNSMKVSTLSLYAPACTVGFANTHYGKAVTAGKLKKTSIFVDIMDDEREKNDTVGPYGKSLLYLVSRALESVHKMPILGMQHAWSRYDSAPSGQWCASKLIVKEVNDWAKFAGNTIKPYLHTKKRQPISTGGSQIDLAHGSFDNDISVVGNTLKRIRGKKLRAEVENLAY